MSTNAYTVIIEEFAERHFIKSFEKKYKGACDVTRTALTLSFQAFDALFDRNIAETIVDTDTVKICKVEFKISSTNQSRHGSGNRCIVAIHKTTLNVNVLLVYMKTDVKGSRETLWWREVVRDSYPEYKKLCTS